MFLNFWNSANREKLKQDEMYFCEQHRKQLAKVEYAELSYQKHHKGKNTNDVLQEIPVEMNIDDTKSPNTHMSVPNNGGDKQ